VTYHCAIPKLFDELTNKPLNTSFNLATDGTYLPQTLYIVEHLLAQDATIDYVFFEFNNINHMPDHLFKTTRSKYYYQLEHLLMSCTYLFYAHYTTGTGLRVTHKLGLACKYLITYFESLFKIGMRKDILKILQYKKIERTSTQNIGSNGYRPLNDHSSQDKEYLKHLDENLERIKKAYENAYLKLDATPYNIAFNTVLREQIKRANARDVKIIYVLTPIEYGFETVSNMLASFYALPEENRIDLSNPTQYPELYLLKNRWDDGHFNHEGAKIYTQKLSEVFNEKNN